LQAAHYGESGTFVMLSSCNKRQLPKSRTVYRVSIVETIRAETDLANYESQAIQQVGPPEKAATTAGQQRWLIALL